MTLTKAQLKDKADAAEHAVEVHRKRAREYKERIAELEQTNAVLQTLLACTLGAEPGMTDEEGVVIEADIVKHYSGRTITSTPIEHDGNVLGVRITVDPIELPDFGSDMGNLLSKEAH